MPVYACVPRTDVHASTRAITLPTPLSLLPPAPSSLSHTILVSLSLPSAVLANRPDCCIAVSVQVRLHSEHGDPGAESHRHWLSLAAPGAAPDHCTEHAGRCSSPYRHASKGVCRHLHARAQISTHLAGHTPTSRALQLAHQRTSSLSRTRAHTQTGSSGRHHGSQLTLRSWRSESTDPSTFSRTTRAGRRSPGGATSTVHFQCSMTCDTPATYAAP